MNIANCTVIRTAAATFATLGGAGPALGQTDTGMEPEHTLESFAGYELAHYGYDEHFCWPLADTPHAQAEELAAAMGGMDDDGIVRRAVQEMRRFFPAMPE